MTRESVAVEQLRRVLPGFVWRLRSDEIAYVYGWVHYSQWGMTGPVSQTIETKSQFQPVIKLIGDTFAYWCPGNHPMIGEGPTTIYEQELILRGQSPEAAAGHYVRSAKVTEQVCPYCNGRIRPLQHGDKVRCHFRFDAEGKWAAWWAERWEW